MEEFWKIAIGTCGIGAIGAFVFWSLYKNWLKIGIFAQLTKKQTFILMLIFLILTFAFGTAALFSYIYVRPAEIEYDRIDYSALEQLTSELKNNTEIFKQLQISLNKKDLSSEESEVISELYERKKELNDEWRSLYSQYSDPPLSLGESISFRRQTIRIKMKEIVDEIESINERLSKFEGKPLTEYDDQRPPLPPTGFGIIENE